MSGAINQSIVYEFTAKNLDGITNQIKAMYEQVAAMAPTISKSMGGLRAGVKDYAQTISELGTKSRAVTGDTNKQLKEQLSILKQLERESLKLASSTQKNPGRGINTQNLNALKAEVEMETARLRETLKVEQARERSHNKQLRAEEMMNAYLAKSAVYVKAAQDGYAGMANELTRARKEMESLAKAESYAKRALAANKGDDKANAALSNAQALLAAQVNKVKELTDAENALTEKQRAQRRDEVAARQARLVADRERRTALREQALQQQAVASGIKSTLGPLIQMAGAYIGIRGIVNQIGQGIDFNLMIEQSTVAFAVMTKSQVKAQQLMADLKKLQSATGIGIREGASGSKSLLAYGFQVEDITDNLKRLKTVAGAVGAPLEDIVYVYGTLRTQGRAYTRDIMQFAMRGIPIYEALATTMGKPVSQIKALTEAGKVGFPEVEKAFKWLVGGGGPFSGMLEARMQTLAGKIDLLGKTWESSLGKMAEASEGPLRDLVGSLQQALEGIDLSMVGRMVAELITAFTSLLPLFSAVGSAIGLVAKGFTSVVSALTWLVKQWPVLLLIFTALAMKFLPMIISQLATLPITLAGIGGAFKLATTGVVSFGAAFASMGRIMLSFLGGPVGMVLTAVGILAGIGVIDFTVNQGSQAADAWKTATAKDPNLYMQTSVRSDAYGGSSAIEQAVYRGMVTFGGATGKMNEYFGTGESGKQQAMQLATQVDDAKKKFNDAMSKVPTILSHADYMTKKWSGEDMTKYIDATMAETQRIKGDMLKELNSTSGVLAKAGLTVPQALEGFFTNLTKKVQTLGYISPTTAGNREDAKKRTEDYIKNIIPKMQGYEEYMVSSAMIASGKFYGDTLTMAKDTKASAGNQIADQIGNAITTLYASRNQSDNIMAQLLQDKYNEYKTAKDKKGADPFSQREYQVKMTQTEMDNVGLEHEEAMKSLKKKWDDSTKQDYSLYAAEVEALDNYYGMKSEQQRATEFYDIKQMDLEMDAANRQIALMDLAHQKEMELLTIEAIARGELDSEYYRKKMALMEKNFRDERQSARFDSAVSKEIPTMKTDIMDMIDGSLAAFSRMSGSRKTVGWDNSKLDQEINRLTSMLNALLSRYGENAPGQAGGVSDIRDQLLALEDARKARNEVHMKDQLDYWKAGVDNVVNDVGSVFTGLTELVGAAGIKAMSGTDTGSAFKAFTSAKSEAYASAGVDQAGNAAISAGDANLAGLGGMFSSVLTSGIMQFVDLLMQVESVSKAFNWMGTILTETVGVLGPVLDSIAGSIVDVLEPIGRALGQILRPIFGILKITGLAFEVAIRLVLIPLQILGEAFTWLYDAVIVPFGNFFIDMINGVIMAINSFLGWMGVHIALIRRLTTSAEQDLAKKAVERLAIDLDYLREKIRAEADSRIKSAKDLYEVGALRASEYERQVKVLNAVKDYVSEEQLSELRNINMTLEEMLGLYKTMNELQKDYDKNNDPAAIAAFYASTMSSIVSSMQIPKSFELAGERIMAAAEKLITAAALISGTTGSVAGFAIGSYSITSDQLANIHAGEMIIPRSFADGLRSGDLTLGGKGGSMGGDTYIVQVTVQGTVQAENDLADTIAETIYRRRTRGQLVR